MRTLDAAAVIGPPLPVILNALLHMPDTPYLQVLKASYDYDPQSEDEIAIKEDQLLFLIERTDDECVRSSSIVSSSHSHFSCTAGGKLR